MPYLPPEILYGIFSYIPDIHDISPLNLVCKNFGCIVQPRQFAEVDLHTVDRAETLAILFSQNPRLLSETSKMRIGNQFTESYEATELWRFLCTEHGKQLLSGMSQVRSIWLSALDLSPGAEDSQVVIGSIENLSGIVQINQLSLQHITFPDVWWFCQFISSLHTLRELELHNGIRFSDASDRGGGCDSLPRSSSVQSLVLGRKHYWGSDHDTLLGLMNSLSKAGQLANLQSVTCHCSYLDVFNLKSLLKPVAGLITQLVLHPLEDLRPTNWYMDEDPDMVFPTISHLKTLTLVDLSDERAEWLMESVQSAQSAYKTLTRSIHTPTRVCKGEESRYTHVYES